MNTSRIAFLFLAALTFAGCADLDGDRDLASRSGAELCPDLCAAKARSGCAGFSMSACVSAQSTRSRAKSLMSSSCLLCELTT